MSTELMAVVKLKTTVYEDRKQSGWSSPSITGSVFNRCLSLTTVLNAATDLEGNMAKSLLKRVSQ